MKTNKSTASKSTELTDAPESKVSTPNPDFIMKSDNSTNPVNAVNSTTPANTDNLFDNEQTVSLSTDTIELPKQQRIGKQQRKSDFTEFKTTFLTPAKVVNRHPVNIEDDIWEQLERIARILGERGTTVASYINAVLAEHMRAYSPDIEIWRKL
ncbi:DUF3408 domain-containing protein [uncultured Duncaniella sp.]|uniref:DUF3408 domain-containing protein n=1 Tax=uncultured Duncaniella sp. TaxID=2768039 RepID=UPI0025A9F7A7|nr:DUF3408 domain-containing protein [uncultured Duncaniella sp.]